MGTRFALNLKVALRFGLSLLSCAFLSSTWAMHPAGIALAKASVDVNGNIELKLRYDLLAFALEQTSAEVSDPPMNALLDGPQENLQKRMDESSARLRDSLKITSELGDGSIDSISYPSAADIRSYSAAVGPVRLPVMLTVRVKAHLPKGARRLSVRFPDILGTLVYTAEFPYQEPISEPVEAGNASRFLSLSTAEEVRNSQMQMRIRKTLPLRHGPGPKHSRRPVKKGPVPDRSLAKSLNLNSSDKSERKKK